MTQVSVKSSTSNCETVAVNGCTGSPISSRSLFDYGDPKELLIPVPYGHIAAKEWGPDSGDPVIALHGWQDNAGSFDNVVSYLPDNIHLIAIDLPGHGLSSHIPNGAVYGVSQYLLDLRRVINYFGWQKFSFLAHSLGAYLAIYYSAIHPDQVVKVASLDVVYPGLRMKDAATVRKYLDGFLKEEQNEMDQKQRSHTFDSAWELMWQRRDGMTKEAVLPLLNRGCKSAEKGSVIFTRDHRLKPFIHQPWEYCSEDATFLCLKNIRAHVLVIVATDSWLTNLTQTESAKAQELYIENCASFKRVDVKGTHFVHLVNPRVVGPPLREFFLRTNKE